MTHDPHSAVPPPKTRVIELLRGLAAFLVVLSHSSTNVANHPDLHYGPFHGGLIIPGGPGVEFFFVLSGFIMVAVHGRDIGTGRGVGRYTWRRVTRIYPLFWLVMAEMVWRYWEAPAITAANVANWVSLLPISSSNLLPVAWTLRQELTFYILFGLVLLPGGWAVLAAWVTGTFAFNLGLIPIALPPVMGFVLNQFTVEFFAGMAAGGLFLMRTRLPDAAWAVVAVGGALLLAWRMSMDGWGMEYGPFGARLTYGAAYASIVLGLAMLERAGRVRLGRWAEVAGVVSYPLYLSHLTVLSYLGRWTGQAGWDAWIPADALFTAGVGAALLVAGALAYGVDRPLQRLLRRPFSRAPGPGSFPRWRIALPGPRRGPSAPARHQSGPRRP